jgi:hypothetical protein
MNLPKLRPAKHCLLAMPSTSHPGVRPGAHRCWRAVASGCAARNAASSAHRTNARTLPRAGKQCLRGRGVATCFAKEGYRKDALDPKQPPKHKGTPQSTACSSATCLPVIQSSSIEQRQPRNETESRVPPGHRMQLRGTELRSDSWQPLRPVPSARHARQSTPQ